MKQVILAAALALATTAAQAQYLGTGSNPNSHPVQGYTTNSGTYVPPHQQTNPNNTQRDNYSTTGNVPPNTRRRGGYGMQHDPYRELYRHHRMPAQDAIRFGYGNAYPTYHSGWGGLYRDGNYPGSVDDNMGPPYWDR